MLSILWSPRDTETDGFVGEVGIAVVARRRADAVGAGGIGAAADRTSPRRGGRRPSRRSCGICLRSGCIRAVEILAPLINIACHIVES